MRTADAYLRQRQVDPGRYHQVAWVRENVDPLAVRYLLEHKSIKESDQTYRLATRLAVFEVRYFRPLEKEEHHVFLDPSQRPGVRLSEVVGRQRARRFALA